VPEHVSPTEGRLKNIVHALARGWILLALPLPLLALDPDKSVFQFNCQNWTRQNGLPAGKINTVTQTANGYIWLGSQNGLVRFDGLKFNVVAVDFPGARGTEVRMLAPTEAEGMLISVNNGGFGSFNGQTFSAIGDDGSTRPGMTGTTVLEARDGAIWTGSNLGLSRWKSGKPSQSLFDETATRVLSLCEGPSGRIWIGTDERGLFYFQNGKVAQVPDPSLQSRLIVALAADPKGQIWVGTNSELRRYDSRGRRMDTPPLVATISALLVDSHGTLWVGTSDRGLVRFRDGSFTFLKKSDGLESDNITSVFEDAEGSLWVGAIDGLSQITDLKFPIYSSKEGLSGGTVHTVSTSRQGGVWVATSTGYCYFDGKVARKYTGALLPANSYIKRAFEARNGDLYLVDGNRAIDVLSGDRLSARYPNPVWPEAMAEDSEGILVGLGPTLARIRNGALEPYLFTGEKKPNFDYFDNLMVAADGGIWASSYEGVFRVKDGKFRQWSLGQGLSGTRVNFIFEDLDHSIWVGLATGMARIKNNLAKSITASNGLPDSQIYAIVPDSRGFFWVDSGRGIFRVRRQELNDFVDGNSTRIQCEVFDGLESIKSTDRTDQGNAGCRTPDGRIWFPSPLGVIMIDPETFVVNRVPPPVHIDQVRINGVASADRKNLFLRPGDGRVEFTFSALSYISPEKIHVQYQLDGLDIAWIDAGGRRSVVYDHLKPGQYTFRVQATNADGISNLSGDELGLRLPPHFYQTGWFYALCSVAAALALIEAYRWKVKRMGAQQRKLKSEFDLLESKVSKRTEELAHERDLLRTLMDSSPDQIYFKDRQSRFVRSGRANAVRLGAKSPAELVGKTDSDFFAPVHANAALADEQEIIRTGLPVIGQIEREVMPDGHVSWVLTTKMPWRDKDGAVIGTFGISKDVTALKGAEEDLAYERDLLRSIMDSLPDRIFFKDLRSHFVRCSAEVVRMLGQDVRDIIGKTDSDFFPKEQARKTFEDEQEIIRTGKPQIGLVEKTVWPDGREGWSLGSKMAWRNPEGVIVGTFGVSKDITALKEAEATLANVHKQLLETSRKAGMAEVATNVLHNVGNVLNSVNVSATCVMDRIRESKLPFILKITAMLDEHAGDLGAFLTQDSKGQKIPAYLSALGADLVAEQKNAIEELRHLQKNIEHIKDIVSMQQSLAKVSGVIETVDLVGLVEDAIRINLTSLTRHNIVVIRDYQVQPTLSLERHKVMQILVNLLRNAKFACVESGRADRIVTLRIGGSGDCVQITVIDNGVGIPKENLTRIFAHGFTTRKEGHGFGLHSGALAAKELGGQLTAQSDGAGKGAVFTLELPLGTANAVSSVAKAV
jgi:PAS domain S-box-containing protein